MDTVKFGSFLKELRKEHGLTQEQLAVKMNVSNRTVSRWETGANVPDLDILIELSEFYQIELRELLNGERQTPKPSLDDAQFAQEVAQYRAITEAKLMRRLFYCIVAEIIVMLGVFCTTMVLFSNTIGGIIIPFSSVVALLIYSLIIPGLQKYNSAVSYRLTLNGGFIATIISNITIIVLFFYEGTYHNYGITGVAYTFAILLIFFSIAGIIVCILRKYLAQQ